MVVGPEATSALLCDRAESLASRLGETEPLAVLGEPPGRLDHDVSLELGMLGAPGLHG